MRKAAATEDVGLLLNVRLIGNLLVCISQPSQGSSQLDAEHFLSSFSGKVNGPRARVCVYAHMQQHFLPGLKALKICGDVASRYGGKAWSERNQIYTKYSKKKKEKRSEMEKNWRVNYPSSPVVLGLQKSTHAFSFSPHFVFIRILN